MTEETPTAVEATALTPLPCDWRAEFLPAGTTYFDEPSEKVPDCDEGWYVVTGYDEEDPRWQAEDHHVVLRLEFELDPDDDRIPKMVAARLNGEAPTAAQILREVADDYDRQAGAFGSNPPQDSPGAVMRLTLMDVARELREKAHELSPGGYGGRAA